MTIGNVYFCLRIRWLRDSMPAFENADPGAVGEMVRFVYIYSCCVPWSNTSPHLKPSPKSISPHWLLLHTVFVFMINDPTGVYP